MQKLEVQDLTLGNLLCCLVGFVLRDIQRYEQRQTKGPLLLDLIRVIGDRFQHERRLLFVQHKSEVQLTIDLFWRHYCWVHVAPY